MSIRQKSIILASVLVLAACGRAVPAPVAAGAPVSTLGDSGSATTVNVATGPRVVFPLASIARRAGVGGTVCAFIHFSDPPPCTAVLEIRNVEGVDFSSVDELGRLRNVRIEGVLDGGEIVSAVVSPVRASASAAQSYTVSQCNLQSGIYPTTAEGIEFPELAAANTPWAVYIDVDTIVVSIPLSDGATRRALCAMGLKMEIRSFGSIFD